VATSHDSCEIAATAATGPRGCGPSEPVGRPRLPVACAGPSATTLDPTRRATVSLASPLEIPSSRASRARVIPGSAWTARSTPIAVEDRAEASRSDATKGSTVFYSITEYIRSEPRWASGPARGIHEIRGGLGRSDSAAADFSSAGLSSVRQRTRPHQRRSLCVSPRRTKPSSGLVFDRRGWPGFRPALTPDPWNAPEIRHIRASGACTLAANGRADTEVSGQVCRAAGSNYEGVAQSDVVRECDNAGTGVNAPATGLGSSWLRIREVVSAGRRNTMGVFVDRSGGVW
jgi:hypothetical protein